MCIRDRYVAQACIALEVSFDDVVAGNVETSQTLIDVLNGAVAIQAACYGTMSNITFGNKSFGYYETICGGTGAGINKNGEPYIGTSGVQSHMTNSRLTDPEILESRFPVIIQEFKIRKNSGGKGKFFGGNGVIRKIKFLKIIKLIF